MENYLSFLIRMSRERIPDQPLPVEWNIEIEHIQSGRRWTFTSMGDLLSFLLRLSKNPEILLPSKEE